MAKKHRGFTDLGPRKGARGTFTPPYYTIVDGDNLTRIAERFGTSVKALQKENGIANPNDIKAWTRIKIPNAKGSSDLGPGQLAFVSFAKRDNKLRTAPVVPAHNPSANVIARIPAGYVVKLASGPVTDSNRTWWEVQYGGMRGWTTGIVKGRPALIPFDPCEDEGIRIVQVAYA